MTIYAPLYASLYERYNNHHERHGAARDRLQAQYEEAVQTCWRKLYPRRKKYVRADVPEADKGAIYDRLQPVADRLVRLQEAELRCLSDRLYQMAGKVDIIPCEEWHEVASCHLSTYRSQGYGAHKYARGALLLHQECLQRRDIECRVEFTDDTYRLLARIEPWRADAVMRAASISDTETVALYQRHGLNHRVYYPFMEGM